MADSRSSDDGSSSHDDSTSREFKVGLLGRTVQRSKKYAEEVRGRAKSAQAAVQQRAERLQRYGTNFLFVPGVGFGVFFGLKLARVGFFKRLVLGSAGASLVFSALYPHDASRLAYETSQRVQKIEWYNEAERFCAWVCDWSLGSNYKPDLSPKKKPQDSDDSTA